MSNTIMPKHVAIILDGNRRWAKQRNLPSLKGHQKGFENIRDLAPYIFDRGVEVLSVYAFSEQNFNRSVEEVGYLMDLFINEFKKEYKKLHEENIDVIKRHPKKVNALNFITISPKKVFILHYFRF